MSPTAKAIHSVTKPGNQVDTYSSNSLSAPARELDP